MKGIVRKITVAAVLLWILPGLSGCGDKDRVDEIKAQGSLVAAVPEEGERSAWDQAYARELEQQVLEEMASDIGVTLRIERVKEQDLVPAVKQGRAHVAVGVPVLPGRQDEGYSLAYGRRASYLAVADGTVLDSWGALEDGIVGYSVNTGPAVLRQLNTFSGIELKEVRQGMPSAGLRRGTSQLMCAARRKPGSLWRQKASRFRNCPAFGRKPIPFIRVSCSTGFWDLRTRALLIS